MRSIRRPCACTSARVCCVLRAQTATRRLYTDEDLERLEFILSLARDMGVNMAGIAIVLQMRERMEEMNRQMQSFVDFVHTEMLTRIQQQPSAPGLVPVRRPVKPSGR